MCCVAIPITKFRGPLGRVVSRKETYSSKKLYRAAQNFNVIYLINLSETVFETNVSNL